MKSIAVYNLKGGVGKTTTIVNLAYLASQQKYKTLLWDWDSQAASTWYLNAPDNTHKKAIKLFNKKVPVGELEIQTPYPRLTLIPADISLRKIDETLHLLKNPRKLFDGLISPLSENAQFLFHDCPPSLSPSVEHLLTRSDLILVPIIPSPLSIRAIEQVVAFFESKKHSPQKLIGFFNQVDLRRNVHKEALANSAQMPIPMLKTWIPYDSAAEQMSEKQAPLMSYATRGRAYDGYIKLWKEIKRHLKKPI